MHFLCSKFTQNALAAGARTPLGELKRSPSPLANFRGAASRQGKGKGRKGKGKMDIGEGKEGGEGREEGRKGKRK